MPAALLALPAPTVYFGILALGALAAWLYWGRGEEKDPGDYEVDEAGSRRRIRHEANI